MSSDAGSPQHRSLEVVTPGLLTTVQDLGRPGLAHSGVGTSGACDRAALRRANRLVGNPEGAAALEATLGGLRLRAHGNVVVAVTGAPGPLHVDEALAAMDTAVQLADGCTLAVGSPLAGARTYVAVHGGVDVPSVLGSRSTDLLAGLGPLPLRRGDLLAVGRANRHWTPVDVAPGPALRTAEVTLRAVLGPRLDWFEPVAVRRIATSVYEVTTTSNRIGLRLAGPVLPRARYAELPSEGLLPGAVQVAPSGQPTVLLADHPVTGGYPVIAVLRDADLDTAGQLSPGQSVRFRVDRIRCEEG